MRAGTLLTFALLILVAGVAGCSRGADVVEGPDGTRLLVASGEAPRMEALGTGRLTRGEDGCLYLAGDGYQDLLVWPAGTRLADDEAAVHVPGAEPVVIGSDVELVGGGVAADERTLPELPGECMADTVFLVSSVDAG
ncbi:hypothetical protein [uncultured Cellulomonas sp.]|uniref:hypothetical protein n=1 Tax=uncultured Cellulomonas sp. TaxID=189682 RepID=UPI0028EC44F5|nr:hypothetical protein [uncultured Cellulomonas sp.]